MDMDSSSIYVHKNFAKIVLDFEIDPEWLVIVKGDEPG